LEDGLKTYYEKYSDLKRSSSVGFDDKFIWNTLDNYKISNFKECYEQFLISENDERIKENKERLVYLKLLKFREFKSCINKIKYNYFR
jgi:hypothetical protein